MFQGPGVMAEKGAKKVVSLRDRGKIQQKMFSDYNRQVTVAETPQCWRLLKNQTSQNPGLELVVALDDF